MIIENLKNHNIDNTDYGLFPDRFVSEKEKQSKDYIYSLANYFYTQAIAGFSYNKATFAHNYSFVKGELRLEDFYENADTYGFIQDLQSENTPLPKYVQQYSILNQPLNTMTGEQSKRPDNARVKAFDDDSKSEELQFKTELLNRYIMQQVQQTIVEKAAIQGIQIDSPEGQQYLQQMTAEQLEEELTNYTSDAEKWANNILEAMKMEFNMKELSEEGFRDLLICGREYYHIYEDKSKLGFQVECVNPKNVVVHTTNNKKYTKGAYAASIIDVMEISEIIEKFPLTKKEVDHLRESIKKAYLVKSQGSNLFNNKTGEMSITYNTYDPLRLQERLKNESMVMSNEYDLTMAVNTGILGERFVVLQSYHLSKKKIGKLTYLNEDGIEEVTLVDENYRSGEHPQQLELEWGYINQWWKTIKIGDDIYYSEPLKILDYCPIIGVFFENRNSLVKGLIDLMKPYQMIFNVVMNQLWELLQKDKGKVMEFNWRKIPVNKDSSYEDALQEWLDQARELGFMFNDDSPENMQAPTSNTNTTKVHDMSLINDMQGRINLALQIQQMANGLVGITPERLGGVAATQTAAGTQAALAASYSQTENFFVTHEYLLNQLYQAIIDTAQYIESEKPLSTISYVNSIGKSAFIQINGNDLKLRDLRVYVTSRAEDQRIFQELRQLAQPMLQNGGSIAEIAEMYVTNSVRSLREVFKKNQEKAEQVQQQQMQLQQQQIQSQQQAVQMQIQAAQQKEAEDRAFEAQQKELDRANKVQVAAINASSRNPAAVEDNNGNGLSDYIESTRMSAEISQANREYNLQTQKIQGEAMNQQLNLQQEQQKAQVEKEKFEAEAALKKEELRIKEKAIDTSLKVAKTNRSQ